MGLCRVLSVGRTITNVGTDDDKRWPCFFFSRYGESIGQSTKIIRLIADILHVPMVGFEALAHIFRKSKAGFPFYGYAVIVVDADEFAETQVPRQRGRLVGSSLHKVTVTAKCINIVVHNSMSVTIENRGKMRFCHGHTHSIHNALAQRSSSGFHPWGEPVFRMARRFAPPLSKIYDFLQGKIVACQMEHGIEQH